jgi:membrane-associated phospholipid phosphatase
VERARPSVDYARVLRTPAELATCAESPDALALRSPGAKAPAFPSHHAISAGAFAAVLTAVSWRLGLLGWVFALLVAWGRIHAGKHWPTDVLAGLAIGSVFGYASWRLVPILLDRLPGFRRAEIPPSDEVDGRE